MQGIAGGALTAAGSTLTPLVTAAGLPVEQDGGLFHMAKFGGAKGRDMGIRRSRV
jgi:hypothetical protein